MQSDADSNRYSHLAAGPRDATIAPRATDTDAAHSLGFEAFMGGSSGSTTALSATEDSSDGPQPLDLLGSDVNLIASGILNVRGNSVYLSAPGTTANNFVLMNAFLNQIGGSCPAQDAQGGGVCLAHGTGWVMEENTWNPGIRAVDATGTMIWGPLSINNNVGSAPRLPTVCTGIGAVGQSYPCDVGTNSSDSDGYLWLNPGVGASATGTITVPFAQTWPELPICTVTLVNGVASWNPGATAILATPNKTELTINWSNNGVPLPVNNSGTALMINYHCLALP